MVSTGPCLVGTFQKQLFEINQQFYYKKFELQRNSTVNGNTTHCPFVMYCPIEIIICLHFDTDFIWARCPISVYLRAPLVLSACRLQSTSSGWQISGMVVTELLIQAVISPNSFIRVSSLQPPLSLPSATLHRLFDWALTIGLLCHWAIFHVTSEWGCHLVHGRAGALSSQQSLFPFQGGSICAR